MKYLVGTMMNPASSFTCAHPYVAMQSRSVVSSILIPSLFSLLFLLGAVFSPAPSFSAEKVLADFSSDGCSLFPDGSIREPGKWCECCFRHDIAYWAGGTREERRTADENLRTCVAERTGDKTLAEIMYDGVRAGGHPAFPTWYRWGYGWKYGRGYEPLSETELAQIAEKLERYYRKHSSGYCRKSAQ